MKDFLTVSQFAKLSGKDPGNIRRLLTYGRMAGEKLGDQWIIPATAEYPDDRRVRSGKYRNWRSESGTTGANPNLIKSLHQMSAELEQVYGDYLVKIVLYGSYARGEAANDSDLDIAVLLREGNTENMHDSMTDIVVDHELEQGVTFSVVPIHYEHYQEWKNTIPFYQNLEREGIVLWKSA